MTRRIAIVPYGVGIGDLVNMRPIAKAIAGAFPDAHTSIVAPRTLGCILPDDVSIVDDVHGLRAWRRIAPTHPVARFSASLPVGRIAPLIRAIPTSGLASLVARDLKHQGFDKVFNLLADFSTLDLDRRWTSGPWSKDREHVIDLLAACLCESGVRMDRADRCPQMEVKASFHDHRPAVILNPTAGSTLKEPPKQLWCDIAAGLKRRGIQPLILGSPGRDVAQSIVASVQGTVHLVSRRLQQAVAWIAGADLVISPDTGLLHVASALGVPYVGLFGSTDPYFLGPYNRALGLVVETRLEHKPVCRACWTAQILPAGRCPLYAPHSCVGGIEAYRVLDAVDHLLWSLIARSPFSEGK